MRKSAARSAVHILAEGTQQGIGGDDGGASNERRYEYPGACERSDGGGTPQACGNSKTPEVETVPQNDAGPEEADAGDNLRRDTCGISAGSLDADGTEDHEEHRTHRDQCVRADSRGVQSPLALETDGGIERDRHHDAERDIEQQYRVHIENHYEFSFRLPANKSNSQDRERSRKYGPSGDDVRLESIDTRHEGRRVYPNVAQEILAVHVAI